MSQDRPEERLSSIPISGEKVSDPEKLPEKTGMDQKPLRQEPTDQELKPKFSRKETPRKKSLGWPKLVVLFILLALFSSLIAGRFLAPFLLETVLAEILAEKTERPITIGSADFDPLSLTLTLHNGIIGPKVNDPDDTVDPILSFSRLSIDLDGRSLQKRALIISQADIDKLFVHLVRDHDSSYNIIKMVTTDLFENETSEKKVPFPLSLFFKTPLRYSCNNISVANSRLIFNDLPAGKTHTIEKVSLALPTLSNFTLETGKGQSAKHDRFLNPKFAAVINGSPIDLTGETKLAGDSLEARLDITLKALDLPSYMGYLPGISEFKVTKGTADLDLHLIFSTGGQAPESQLQLQGTGIFTDIWLHGIEGALTKIPHLKAAGSFSPLLNRYHFKDLRIKNPEIQLDRLNSGDWATPGFTLKQSEKHPIKLAIDRLRVTDARISFVDRSIKGGFSDTWSDIQLTLDSFSPGSSKPASFLVNGTSETGTRISSQGTITDTLLAKTEGLLVVEQLDSSRLAPYLSLLPKGFRLQSATIPRFESHFTVSRNLPEEDQLYIFRDISVSIIDLSLAHLDQEWLRVPAINISKAGLNFSERLLDFGSVEVNNGHLMIKKDKNGITNWQSLELDDTKKDPSAAWKISLQSLNFVNSSIDIEDQTFRDPLKLHLTDFTGLATHLSNEEGKIGQVAGSLFLEQKNGRLHYTGTAAFNPFSLTLDCQVEDLLLTSIRPLLTEWYAPEITEGTMKAKGKVTLPDFSFHGLAGITSFTSVNNDGRLAEWQNAVAQDLQLTFTPFSLTIPSISVDKPYLNWTIYEDRNSSLADMFVGKEEEKQTGDPSVIIDKIVINAGFLEFIDQTAVPPKTTKITPITGAITTLKDVPQNRCLFDLQGIVDDVSPLSFTGNLGFFDPFIYADFKTHISELNLAENSQYIESSLGYAIKQGSLAMTTAYHQEDGTIKAENKILLKDFKLGRRLGDSSHLPLTLALLTDTNGNIQMNLPVSGTTGDPSFSYRTIVIKMFRNLLLKTAISPFSLLATLLPKTSSPDLDHIIFPFGASHLPQEKTGMLHDLTEALKQRPWLKIRIKAFADAKGDREAIISKWQSEAAQRHLKEETRMSETLSSHYGNEEINRVNLPAEKKAPQEAQPSASFVEVKDAILVSLARQRAQSVHDTLISLGTDPDRLILDKDVILVPEGSLGRSGNRVDFKLETIWK